MFAAVDALTGPETVLAGLRSWFNYAWLGQSGNRASCPAAQSFKEDNDLRNVRAKCSNFHRVSATRDRGDTGARDFDEAQRHHQADELVDLVRLPGQFKDETVG